MCRGLPLDNIISIFDFMTIGAMVIYMAIASFYDIKYKIIPDELTITFFFLRLFAIPIMGFRVDNVSGLVVGFLLLLIPAMIANKKMGGDIKAAAITGFYYGVYGTGVFLAILCIISLAYLVVSKKIKSKQDIPLAPFFLASHIVMLIISATGIIHPIIF